MLHIILPAMSQYAHCITHYISIIKYQKTMFIVQVKSAKKGNLAAIDL